MSERSDRRYLRRQEQREEFWRDFRKEMRDGGREALRNTMAAADDAPNHRFRHGQHIFLSVITCGLWVPVWAFAHDMHRRERVRRLRAARDA